MALKGMNKNHSYLGTGFGEATRTIIWRRPLGYGPVRAPNFVFGGSLAERWLKKIANDNNPIHLVRGG